MTNSAFQGQERRRLRALLYRIQEQERLINSPGTHPDGLREPRAFSRIFGPIGLQRASTRTADTPPEATLVNPAAYITPNYPGTANIIVGDQTNFFWHTTDVTSELSWTYTSAIDSGSVPQPIDTRAVTGLYDAALGANGGAVVLNNFAGTPQFSGAPSRPRVCFELDLYDKTRGRSITGGRIGPEIFTALQFNSKKLPSYGMWEHGTEIEPRLYVTECAMTDFLNNNAGRTDASQVAAWVTLTFMGHVVRV